MQCNFTHYIQYCKSHKPNEDEWTSGKYFEEQITQKKKITRQNSIDYVYVSCNYIHTHKYVLYPPTSMCCTPPPPATNRQNDKTDHKGMLLQTDREKKSGDSEIRQQRNVYK